MALVAMQTSLLRCKFEDVDTDSTHCGMKRRRKSLQNDPFKLARIQSNEIGETLDLLMEGETGTGTVKASVSSAATAQIVIEVRLNL